jgi:hypothetical protein
MSAAQEASDSRLYGGIHFRFDNEEGLSLGRKVGELAISAIKKASVTKKSEAYRKFSGDLFSTEI